MTDMRDALAAQDRAMREFPRRLGRAMDARGVRNAELAAMTGIAGNTVREYRAGNRNPTMANLVAIAAALGASVDWLTGLAG